MRSVDGHRRHNVFSFQTEIHKREKRKPMSQMMHSTKGKEKRFLNRSESRMVLTIGKATIHRPVLHPCPMKKSFARALEHSTINTVNRTFAAPARRASSFMGFKKSYNLREKEEHLPTIVFQDCVSESTDCIAEGSDSKRPDSANSNFYTITSGTKHENLPRITVETSENLDKHIRPKIVNLRPWENDKLKSSKKTTVFDTQDTERERNIACLMNWLIEYNAKQQEADGLRTQSGQNKNECGDQELRTEQAILSCAGATRCVNDADRNWLTGVLMISSNIAPNSKNFVQFLPKIMRPSLHLKNGLIVEGKFSGHTLPVLKKDNKMCLKNHRRTYHKTLKQQGNEEDSDQLVRLKSRLHERDLLEKESDNKYNVLSHTNQTASTETEEPNIRDSEQSSLPKLYLSHHSFATGNRSKGKEKDKKCIGYRRISGTYSWAKRVEQNKQKYPYPKKSNESKRSVICRREKESTLSVVNCEFSHQRKEDEEQPSRIALSPLRGFTPQLSEFSDTFRL